MADRVLIPAAQYVRMSTEKQIYSTANQAAAIASYALTHNFRIVQTYADKGRSGLHLKGREALQSLLRDVLAREPGYQAILIFDVSRWGRFQDVDESAHYEWLVRNAGVAVHYCAETFENDGSLSSAIMKTLKRVMASEYSRELSVKVWAAQVHQAKLGFRMGGATRFGLRRLLVAPDGTPRMLLEHGERKYIRDDRVVLVPGPASEQAIVRRIYRLSISSNLSDRQVAELLNSEGVPAQGGKKWTQYQIKDVLTGEVYTGTITFNRRSSRLGGKVMDNPETEWVRLDNAFAPIISHRTFVDAQRARHKRRVDIYSNEQLLDGLRSLLGREGRLSLDLIVRAPDLPHPASYRRRFGSLHAAFAAIGYYPPHRGPAFGPHSLQSRNRAFSVQVSALLKSSGAHIQPLGPVGLLRVDRSLTLGITVSRFHSNPARQYWKLSLNRAMNLDYVFVGLLDAAGEHIRRYYLIPIHRFPPGNALHFSETAPNFECYRLPFILSLYPALLERAEPDRLAGKEQR